jgi:hypothetical protein
MATWKVRDEYFKGASSYTIRSGEKSITIDVDETGHFQTSGWPPVTVGVFAKLVKVPVTAL